MGKASPTGGVKPMSIGGRFVTERERLFGMTDAERAFRKQFLKDQELAHNEPKIVPEMYKATHNPIRRLYRWPLDKLAETLTPSVGLHRASYIRYMSGKICMGIAAAYAVTYYFKYNKSDWTRKGGWRVLQSRVAVVEGDPDYPKLSDKSKPSDYGARGFNDMKLKL